MSTLRLCFVLPVLWCGCSTKSVEYKDRVYVVPSEYTGYVAVVYGAKANLSDVTKDASGWEVLTIPSGGVLCLAKARPPTVVGVNEYRVGDRKGPLLTLGKTSATLPGPQVWWRSNGVYFPANLGMRSVQSTSEAGAVHHETFFVSAGGIPVASEIDERTFNEHMSKHCGF